MLNYFLLRKSLTEKRKETLSDQGATLLHLSTFVFGIMLTKEVIPLLKRELQTILCQLSELADNLIVVIQMLEEICIEYGDED